MNIRERRVFDERGLSYSFISYPHWSLPPSPSPLLSPPPSLLFFLFFFLSYLFFPPLEELVSVSKRKDQSGMRLRNTMGVFRSGARCRAVGVAAQGRP